MKPTIRIGSYNTGLIRIQLAGYTIFEFAPYVEFRYKYIAGAIADVQPDIVCFQEIFSRRHLKFIRDSLVHSHPHSFSSLSLRPKLFGAGLVVFSRFPIVQANSFWFRSQLLDEAIFAPRAFQAVTIDTGSHGLIEIINCHTTAGGARHHPESRAADRCRQLQINEMMEFSNARDASVAHSLIVGDLNCGPEASNENYQSLISGGYTDLVVNAINDSRAPITWDPLNPLNVSSPHRTSPPQRIDHILATSSAKFHSSDFRVIGQHPIVEVSPNITCTPSDHYGVLVAFSGET